MTLLAIILPIQRFAVVSLERFLAVLALTFLMIAIAPLSSILASTLLVLPVFLPAIALHAVITAVDALLVRGLVEDRHPLKAAHSSAWLTRRSRFPFWTQPKLAQSLKTLHSNTFTFPLSAHLLDLQLTNAIALVGLV
jgi:hypothetical protein